MRINSANTQKTTLLITLIACILTYTLVKTTNRVKAADTTVALIQELADGLLQADITVDQLASSAGSISQRRGFGYEIASRDKSISEVFIGVADMNRNAQVPSYVELSFRPKFSDLPKALGQWHRVPANPEGNPWSYSTTYTPHGPKIQITLFAALSDDANNPSARVQSLTLRRDKW
jgi:hypothetical protein